jgi:hypothetical protein
MFPFFPPIHSSSLPPIQAVGNGIITPWPAANVSLLFPNPWKFVDLAPHAMTGTLLEADRAIPSTALGFDSAPDEEFL